MGVSSDLPLAVIVGAGAMSISFARELADDHALLVCDIRAELAARVADDLRAEGRIARAAVCDVTEPSSVDSFARTVATLGGFRTLVHVAGLSPSAADWRTIMSVNLIGPTLIERALLPLVCTDGAAIFVASMAGHLATCDAELLSLLDDPLAPGFWPRIAAEVGKGGDVSVSAYQLSKAALIRLCRRRASAWGRNGARILSVSPGMISSPMGAQEMASQPQKRTMFERSPLRREGEMREIAEVVSFLASPRASFITGTDILVDGGLTAAVRTV